MDRLLPPPDALYSPPLRGRMAVMGLQGATVASLVYGGLPSQAAASEPSGDAGEGRDLPVTLAANRNRDGGGLSNLLPSAQTLDYVHKFSSATLITLALGLLLVYAILRPRRALRVLEGRAGAA